MNPERACEAAASAIREYVRARSSYKQDKNGDKWSAGMTLVNPEDKRIAEIARLVIEAVIRVDDGRSRTTVETRALRLGDVFTRYAIKDGVGVDEEVTVIKVTTNAQKSTIKYRRSNDQIAEATIDASYLVAVMRPTTEDLRAQLEEDGRG